MSGIWASLAVGVARFALRRGRHLLLMRPESVSGKGNLCTLHACTVGGRGFLLACWQGFRFPPS